MNLAFYNQWPNLFRFKSFNWIDFSILNVTFEYGTYKGTYLEITVMVMGLGINIEFVDRASRAAWMAGMGDVEAMIRRAGGQTTSPLGADEAKEGKT